MMSGKEKNNNWNFMHFYHSYQFYHFYQFYIIFTYSKLYNSHINIILIFLLVIKYNQPLIFSIPIPLSTTLWLLAALLTTLHFSHLQVGINHSFKLFSLLLVFLVLLYHKPQTLHHLLLFLCLLAKINYIKFLRHLDFLTRFLNR